MSSTRGSAAKAAPAERMTISAVVSVRVMVMRLR